MSDSKNGGDLGAFLAGFIIGGLVGAAVALILAPQSGEETRTQLRQQSDELRSRAMQSAQSSEYLNSARERLQTVQSTTADVQNRARIVLDAGKARITGSPSPSERMMTGEEDTGEDSTES